MTLFAEKHDNCPTCTCLDAVVDPAFPNSIAVVLTSLDHLACDEREYAKVKQARQMLKAYAEAEAALNKMLAKAVERITSLETATVLQRQHNQELTNICRLGAKMRQTATVDDEFLESKEAFDDALEAAGFFND